MSEKMIKKARNRESDAGGPAQGWPWGFFWDLEDKRTENKKLADPGGRGGHGRLDHAWGKAFSKSVDKRAFRCLSRPRSGRIETEKG